MKGDVIFEEKEGCRTGRAALVFQNHDELQKVKMFLELTETTIGTSRVYYYDDLVDLL